MSETKWYAEDHELSSTWSWVIIILFSAAIAGFGWLVYSIIPDAPRRWDFGQLPDTPAESIYSTEEPRQTKYPQRQLLGLPEAQREPNSRPR
jgi:hypothetical protein